MYQGIEAKDVEYPDVSQQSDDDLACGVFALAFACSRLLGPLWEQEICNFDSTCMRDHLQKCLEEKKVTQFPRIEIKVC